MHSKKPLVILGTGSLHAYGLPRIFEIAKKAGFDGLELMMRGQTESGFWDTWDAKYLKKLEKEYALPIITIHSPYGFDDNLIGWEEVQELAKKLEVEQIVCHIPYLSNKPYLKWFKKNYPGKSDCFTLLAENLSCSGPYPETLYDGVTQWQTLPAMCFDINHAQFNYPDPSGIIAQLDNIKQFHVSNYDGKNFHRSILENKPLFKKIFKQNKTAIRSVEYFNPTFPDFRDQEEVVSILKDTIEFIKESSV